MNVGNRIHSGLIRKMTQDAPAHQKRPAAGSLVPARRLCFALRSLQPRSRLRRLVLSQVVVFVPFHRVETLEAVTSLGAQFAAFRSG
jgi:hypothetical protein